MRRNRKREKMYLEEACALLGIAWKMVSVWSFIKCDNDNVVAPVLRVQVFRLCVWVYQGDTSLIRSTRAKE